jgi:hypothetical protein
MSSTSKPTATRGLRDMQDVTIRRAFPDDERELVRLAQLDSQRPIKGDMLIAEVGGQLRAAVPVGGRGAIADPFFPTASLVSLLSVRAAQLHNAESGQIKRPRRRLLPWRARSAAA